MGTERLVPGEGRPAPRRSRRDARPVRGARRARPRAGAEGTVSVDRARGAGAARPEVRAFPAYSLTPPPLDSLRAKLDFNESPFDVPAEVKEEVLARLRSLRWSRYPAFGSPRLVEAIARHAGRPPEEVVVGNGSGELLLAAIGVLAGGGGTVVTAPPTFSLYGQLCAVAGAREAAVPRTGDAFVLDEEAFLSALGSTTRAVGLVCSPNNPTGGTAGTGFLSRAAEASAALLVDQAYVDFAEPEDDARPLLSEHGNVVVFRTLSKAFAAAGFRIGYALAPPALAREVRKAVLPFNVDLAAEELALALLGRPHLRDAAVAAVKTERARVSAALRARGARVAPSRSNFLFFSLPGVPAGRVHESLLSRGVLVRRTGPAEGEWLRVTIGTVEEDDLFLAALEEVR
ncbi:MAG: histidinol-phosphate aminotransferase family protein [Acidobacteria bacterium]|nr:MAG: histidinol-phosphate aminotransferase family protein [Acidobacteriota bacterium]